MTKYLLKNFIRLLALLFFVSLATFALIEYSPIDPITAYIQAGDAVSPQQKAEIANYFGTNQNPVQRYITWLTNILKGDFGISIIYRTSIINVIKEKFASSLTLMLCAFTLSGILGLGTGLLMGLNQTANKILKPICLTISATPTYFIGILFLSLFSVKLGWFPMGFSSPIGVLAQDVTLSQKLHHLVLPVLALSSASFPSLALHTCEKTQEISQTDYVLLAKTRGFSNKKIITRHILRNILLPFITLQFSSLSEIFGGSILAEVVFSYAGLGSVIVDAGLKGDVTLLLGVTLFSCTFVFVGNFTANILYSIIDPKIRLNGGNI